MSEAGSGSANAADVRKLFFSKNSGGSPAAREAVEALVEAYRVVFKYLGNALPIKDQYEIENIHEDEEKYSITPDQLKRQLEVIFMSVHMDDSSREKFRDNALAMGFKIDYESGLTPADAEMDFRANLAASLANHYSNNIMLERAFERGGRRV